MWKAVSCLESLLIGKRINDSKIIPSFHKESLSWRCGILGYSFVSCWESTIVLMTRWYACLFYYWCWCWFYARCSNGKVGVLFGGCVAKAVYLLRGMCLAVEARSCC